MRAILKFVLIGISVITFAYNATAQDIKAIHSDTLPLIQEKQKSYKLRLLVYMRVISDPKGSVRFDENIVPNFRILKWLRMELGIRQGERTQYFNSYYHYKMELQTKWLAKKVRLIARISDNVITFPAPPYRKTNELFVVETKYPLSKSFQGLASLGYVFSAQQNNDLNALPTSQGTLLNYPTFKIAIRYLIKNKGFIEAVYGSYDVFNPYELNKPFVQLTEEYELSHLCTFYSYLRYQYNNNFLTPNNYFLGAGILFHFLPG